MKLNVRKIKMEEMSCIAKRFDSPTLYKGNKTHRVRKKNCIFRSPPPMHALKYRHKCTKSRGKRINAKGTGRGASESRAGEPNSAVGDDGVYSGFPFDLPLRCRNVLSYFALFRFNSRVSSFVRFGGEFFSVAVMTHFPISFCSPFLPVEPLRVRRNLEPPFSIFCQIVFLAQKKPMPLFACTRVFLLLEPHNVGAVLQYLPLFAVVRLFPYGKPFGAVEKKNRGQKNQREKG